MSQLYLLAVGVNQFRDPDIRPLRWAVNDAEKLYARFTGGKVKNAVRGRLLVDEAATLGAFKEGVGEWVANEASEDDSVLVYVASHGCPEIRDTNPGELEKFLLLHDSSHLRPYSTAFSLTAELPPLLRRIRASNVVVALDCCFSGASKTCRSIEGHRLRLARLTAGGNALSAILRHRGARLELGEGRTLLLACGADECSEEDDALEQGVFTYFLLEALTRTRSLTTNITQLYESVAKQVVLHTEGRQNPVLDGRIQRQMLPIP